MTNSFLDTTMLFQLCHLLAKRNNPSFEFTSKVHWTTGVGIGGGKSVRRCLICQEIIPPLDGRKDNRDAHGMQHIKDSGLLPFM